MIERLDHEGSKPDGIDHGRPVRFSDETSTGESTKELRGPRKISIAARMDGDPNDFDWLRRLHCDFAEFLPNREIKSAEVLVLCKNNPKAQQSVVRNIRDADIFVLDLFEDYHKTLEALKAIAPDASRPLASLADTGCLSREELMKFLAAGRRMALIRSILPLIEDLRIEAASSSGIIQPLIDLDNIGELSEKELKELVIRFTVLFSDALNPEVRANAIARQVATRCISDRCHFAVDVLEATAIHDMTFDRGSDEAIARLVKADTILQDQLDLLQYRE